MSTPTTRAVTVLLGLALGGCTIPAYKTPAGFSSTYFRQLYGPDPLVRPAAPTETPPFEEPPPPLGQPISPWQRTTDHGQ